CIVNVRRGGRARSKASDSKSDRGPEGPSGGQILSPPPNFPNCRRSAKEPEARRGDRAAEGAALEMPCTGNPCAPGSNPGPSASCVRLGRARRGVSGALYPAIRFSGVEFLLDV